MGDLDGGILILLRGKQDCYGCEDQYNMVCKTLMAILRERQGGGGAVSTLYLFCGKLCDCIIQ